MDQRVYKLLLEASIVLAGIVFVLFAWSWLLGWLR